MVESLKHFSLFAMKWDCWYQMKLSFGSST